MQLVNNGLEWKQILDGRGSRVSIRRTARSKKVLRNPAPAWGGTMAPASGLVFTGKPEGEFIPINDETGEVICGFQTGTGIAGRPITCKLDGEWYIATVAGGVRWAALGRRGRGARKITEPSRQCLGV
jgi:hypothetical protein